MFQIKSMGFEGFESVSMFNLKVGQSAALCCHLLVIMDIAVVQSDPQWGCSQGVVAPITLLKLISDSSYLLQL